MNTRDGISRKELVARREALGLRQSELARQLGMSRQSYHNYERGYRSITIPMALALARLLHCRLEDLTTAINF